MEETNKTTTENVKAEKEESITIKKQDLWKYSTFVLAAVVVVGIFMTIGGDGGVTGNAIAPTAAPSAPSAPSAPTEIKIAAFDPKTDHFEGDVNAPVTIYEYSDFQCPFCARFYTQTLGQLKSEYVDTGKVKLVFRDYPLSFHPEAQKAAEAAECAGEQDKFWEMHDLLFENQATLSVANYKSWAGQLGLDQSQFDSCLDSGKFAQEVQDDFKTGQAAGVRGTPGFVVEDANGKTTSISGAQPFANFKQVVDASL
jgi:protein-disulfide isomerase